MRFINEIFTTQIGKPWSNQDLLQIFEPALKALPLDEPDYLELRDAVRYYLVGDRTRRAAHDPDALRTFESRARAFETGVDRALDDLVAHIVSALDAGVVFDAILTTTSTGHLMPGISYRMAHRLGSLVRTDSLFIDLGGAGCTGSLKAVNLARALDASIRHILVVSVELASILVNTASTDPDVWQGNCTFGDGAAALWISPDPDRGTLALRLDEMHYTQQADTGLHLIHWDYGDYYTFRLADDATFNRDVQRIVAGALKETEPSWRDEPCWAIHPAGISLLVRLSHKLNLSADVLKPSIAHYKQYSNMSSASILYILKDLAGSAPSRSYIHLLTMGAGFNVIYGRVQKDA